MYSNVKQLWIRGVRRSETELANDPGHFGCLVLHRLGGHRVLMLKEYGNNTGSNEVLSRMFEPMLHGWGGANMTFRGFQKYGRGEGTPVYVQEWRVMIIGEHPPRSQG